MKKRIMELTGCVNSRNFHSYSAGEVLFLGASFGKVFFNRRGEKLVSVRYDFAIRANRSDTLVGELALGAVDGWEYVWSIPHADSGTAKVDYDAAVVDWIYPTADLGTLGIGKGR